MKIVYKQPQPKLKNTSIINFDYQKRTITGDGINTLNKLFNTYFPKKYDLFSYNPFIEISKGGMCFFCYIPQRYKVNLFLKQIDKLFPNLQYKIFENHVDDNYPNRIYTLIELLENKKYNK